MKTCLAPAKANFPDGSGRLDREIIRLLLVQDWHFKVWRLDEEAVAAVECGRDKCPSALGADSAFERSDDLKET